jgi:pimeloyl-ACP methyl ester carboxylesterase
MMKKYALAFVLLLGLTSPAFTQELISYEETDTYSAQYINAIFGTDSEYDVIVYRVLYATVGVFNEADTASGIIAVPVDPMAAFPTLLYDHGTVGNRFDVPSEGSGEKLFAVALASLGYHCVAPDYIGLGISKGLHPYLHPESEARAGIDLIHAVKGLSETEDVHFNEQLFITGYSQGGHAAMATSRMLQESGELTVTASAPMSGPYSVSQIMRDFTLGDEPYFFCAYLGSVCLTAIYAYPDLMAGIEIEDIFLPEYASLVRSYEAEEEDLFDVNESMIALLSANGGQVLPVRMLKEEVAESIFSDGDDPLFNALKRMDVHDWIPEMPLRMFYCKGDDQVSYENSVYTDLLMNSLGAVDVASEDVLSSADHGQCFIPATLKMLQFFANYQRIDQINATDLQALDALKVWPNPSSGMLYLEGEPLQNGPYALEFYDVNGRKCLTLHKAKPQGSIDLSALQSGLYNLRLVNAEGSVAHARIILLD